MLVGKTLEAALKILEKQGITDCKVIRYNSDRPVKGDCELVIRERISDNGQVELVVTDVLLEI